MKLSMVVAGAALVAVAACARPSDPAAKPVNTAKIVDTIQTIEVQQNDNWAAHDVGKIVAFFAPDAQVILPGAPVMKGGKALSEGIEQALDDPNFSLTFASHRVLVARSGDLAVAKGTYKQSGTDPATHKAETTVGTYLTVFRPQPDGSWKGQWDIVTPGPSAPAPSAAPAAGN